MSGIKELVKAIATSIVDYPEQVSVAEIRGVNTTVIELKVAQEDIGKIIGKGGNTVSAIRTILSNAGRKRNQRIILEIIDSSKNI